MPEEREYLVTWIVGVTARSPREAAREARRYQRPGTDQLVFFVQEEGKDKSRSVCVDLDEEFDPTDFGEVAEIEGDI